LFSPTLAKGDALVFDHRILHDVPVWHGTSPHIILRTDVIFERCASHALSWNSFPLSAGDLNMDIIDGTLKGYHDIELDKYISFLPEVRTAPLAKLFRHMPLAIPYALWAVLLT